MAEPIQLFLIDDHTMVRQGISALLSQCDNINVVGEAGNGTGVVELIKESKADVVALDLSLPGEGGLDICRRIVRKSKGVAVLILTMHGDEEYVSEALRSGAKGYLMKGAEADQLEQAIRTVAAGELYLGPGISPEILQNMDRHPKDDPYDLLTPRERLVLKMIAEGKTNKITAEELGISTKTVDTHRWRLMKKLNIHDQTTLVKYALRKGIADLN
jgi:DNA-binding NarL/FixJ family response regulator